MLEETRLKSNPNRIWLIAIVLGGVFDFLFWKREIGLNFALFMTLCLLGGLVFLLTDGLRPAPRSLWLLLPFVFFAVIAVIRQEPLTIFLACMFTLFALGTLANTYVGGHWTQYGLRDYFSKYYSLIGGIISLPFDSLEMISKDQATRGKTEIKLLAWAILRGLLIALPIVTCFASLLASADAIFQQKIVELLSNFSVLEIPEKTIRLLIILFIAWILAGVFLYTAARSNDREFIKPAGRNGILGFTESAIVLGSVTILFLTFVVIQFQYFFGGQTNIGAEGFTYSQYARRGFSELITVAFFSLVLILGLNAFARRDNEIQRRVHIALNATIVAEVLVMLVSAYQRLMLAIDWHGFSRLRLYPWVFMVWLGILLVAVIVLEILRLEKYSALAFVLASLGFAASLTFVNVDASIMRHNLDRAVHGRNLNVPDLASLSADSIPALVDGFRDPRMSAEQREGIGAILTCYLHSDVMESSDDWRSYNFSRGQAKRLLEEIQPLLIGYRYNEKKTPSMARTPSGVYYECWRLK